MGDPIRRHSPPIRGRARMLRLVCPTIPRGLLTPHGLRLSWQIVRDRRPVTLRRARTRVPSQPPEMWLSCTRRAVCLWAGGVPRGLYARTAVRLLPAPRDPSHKPHPPTVDRHLLRGGVWPVNPWRP